MNFVFVSISYLGMIALAIGDNLRGPLFPEILSDLNLKDGAGSWFFAMASIVAFGASLISRWIMQKFGLKILFLLSLVMLSLSCVVAAISHSFIELLLSSVLFGFGSGTSAISQNLLVQEGGEESKRAGTGRKVMAGLHGMYALASLMAPLLVANMGHVHWRMAFGLTAILPACFWVIAYLKLPEFSPRSLTRHRTPIQEQPGHKKSHIKKHKSNLSEFLFVIMVGCFVAAELTLSTRLALYVRRYQLGSIEQASLWVSAFFAWLLVGRGFFTLVHVKYSNFAILVGGLLASSVLTFVGLWSHPAFLALAGLSFAPLFPVAMVYAREIFGIHSDSAVAYSQTSASLMVIVMHLGIGYLSEQFGLRAAMHLGLIMGLCSLGILVYHQRLWKNSLLVHHPVLKN